VKDSMMEDINNIMNIAEVPNLFIVEDWEEMVQDYKMHFKDKYDLNNREVVINLFKNYVKKNLHIILTFQPVGSRLRN
jgi:dynein heavy chain, axonemal